MVWYWWLLIGLLIVIFLLLWLAFWASVIMIFYVVIEEKYPRMAELRMVRRTKSNLDKIPSPILWAVGPLILIYLYLKTRKHLIQEGSLKKNQPLLILEDLKYFYRA